MWLVFALLTAILWGMCYTCTEQTVKHASITTYLFISCFVSALFFLLFGFCDGSMKNDIVQGNLIKVWPYITISTVTSLVACYSSVAAVKYGGASFASIIEISYPVWVIVFTSMLNGKNTVTPQTILGGLLIFFGTYVVLKSHG